MKKGLVILMALALVFAFAGMAMAKTETNVTAENPAKGNIVANDYEKVTNDDSTDTGGALYGKSNYNYYEQGLHASDSKGANTTYGDNFDMSTHVYGTWNSPYTVGIDGFNYNDPQDYVADGRSVTLDETYTVFVGGMNQTFKKTRFESGPHGGYLTSTHRCRECHAVHRAAGKFKLLRSDSRFEACDWCHGQGAGSGYNIQMDNNDNYTTEYNVGHTMGYGIDSGKWKAPDDTYPAFTPNYYMGGFSCFDCHSPHANPARIMGYDQNGNPIPSIVNTNTGEVYNIGNPGHDLFTSGGKGFAQPGDYVPALGMPLPKSKPYYLAGSWLLIKNPDREIASTTTVNVARDISTFMGEFGFVGDGNITVTAGQEIDDAVTAPLKEFDPNKGYPVNKVPTDWNNPIGSASLWDEDFNTLSPPMPMPPANENYGYNVRNPFCRSLILDEFCTDCHDGNAGFHTTQAPLFSEDRALRGQMTTSDNKGNSVTGNTTNWKGSYDLAYGHDTNIRH